LKDSQPDLLILDEWAADKNAQLEAFLGEGWTSASAGPTILSRFPMVIRRRIGEEEVGRSWSAPAFSVDLETPDGPIGVVAVHLPTPRDGLEHMMTGRWHGIPTMIQTTKNRRHESEVSCQLAREISGPIIVAGDFNMPVDSAIYREFWSDWQNAFSVAGCGYGHTKFTRRFGVRIDHVLASDHWRVLKARVGPDLGGDHRPVIVELQLKELN
jgi:endonuclease/exonuclease/phosphatase family metal-dependent hydrolase